MNDLKIFSYKDAPVRTIERDDGLWWVLKDVCGVLSLSRTVDVARRLDGDEVDFTNLVDANGKRQEMYIVNEPGLYTVILRSNKKEAKDFKRWVTHEVLPSIRQTGSYSLTAAPKTAQLPDGVTFSSVVGFMRLTRRVMLDMGSTPVEVGMMVAETCKAVNFPVPTSLAKQLPGQLDMFNRPGLEAAAIICRSASRSQRRMPVATFPI